MPQFGSITPWKSFLRWTRGHWGLWRGPRATLLRGCSFRDPVRVRYSCLPFDLASNGEQVVSLLGHPLASEQPCTRGSPMMDNILQFHSCTYIPRSISADFLPVANTLPQLLESQRVSVAVFFLLMRSCQRPVWEIPGFLWHRKKDVF